MTQLVYGAKFLRSICRYFRKPGEKETTSTSTEAPKESNKEEAPKESTAENNSSFKAEEKPSM